MCNELNIAPPLKCAPVDNLSPTIKHVYLRLIAVTRPAGKIADRTAQLQSPLMGQQRAQWVSLCREAIFIFNTVQVFGQHLICCFSQILPVIFGFLNTGVKYGVN